MSEHHSVAPASARAAEPARERPPRLFMPEELPDEQPGIRSMPPAWDAVQLQIDSSPRLPEAVVAEPAQPRRAPGAGLLAGAGLGLVAAAVVGLVLVVDTTIGGAVSPLIGAAVGFGVTGVVGAMPARLGLAAGAIAALEYGVAVLWASTLAASAAAGRVADGAVQVTGMEVHALVADWFSQPVAYVFLVIAVLPVVVAQLVSERRRG
ncbi:hypothetical protein QQX10_09135 [Demequina sp. SYSU T00039]|uniref:Uncharacterized protein n=1 Tax=Demequina lignilytica TaxID=3051663 RepID=A0AAW7M955_9MICO|nr:MULTISPECIES: hypothetical protein [unclassified Demequina]MDN4478220.1 hypothetical protein [Demequina sp. SYSU T00039-1]MDN4488330.1 hypothetical protein [Demequina sp. SYSU T00039]